MAVAAATLCAPVVTAGALAAIAAVGGGNHAEMGSLAGTQGLRGTTIGTTSPAPPAVTGPVDEPSKSPAKDDSAGIGESPAQSGTHHAQQQPTSGQRTSAPTHKPTQPAPKPPPSSRVGLNPPTQDPYPNYDPTGPGAPTSSGTSTGGTTSTSGQGTSTPDGG
jgi:hypothetical protein